MALADLAAWMDKHRPGKILEIQDKIIQCVDERSGEDVIEFEGRPLIAGVPPNHTIEYDAEVRPSGLIKLTPDDS